MRLGLDIDGTITLDPNYFANVAANVRRSGGSVHIVTSRSEIGRSATIKELRGYRVQYDAIYFLPEMSVGDSACPHKSLDWFRRYLWQKIEYSLNHDLTHFVDDDSKVLSLFADYAAHIVAIPAPSFCTRRSVL